MKINNKAQINNIIYGSQFALNVVLQDVKTKTQFHLTNVHLKAKEEFFIEREVSIAELLKYLQNVYNSNKEIKYFFIDGDFNADPDECGINLIQNIINDKVKCSIHDNKNFPDMKFSRVPTANINNFPHTTYKLRDTLEARTIDHFFYLARDNKISYKNRQKAIGLKETTIEET